MNATRVRRRACAGDHGFAGEVYDETYMLSIGATRKQEELR